MTPELKADYTTLYSADKDLRYNAFQKLLLETENEVDWIYEVWDEIVKLAGDNDNHLRTISVQLISNLAKSDHKKRLPGDFEKLYKVTFDDKFVTARHSLRCLWKIGIVNKEYLDLLTDALSKRFREALREKNGTLLRFDILEIFKKIYEVTNDQSVR
ncbi:MAG: hypothetical protein EOO02_21405, partial [Chitinophagaceae bacterium]